MLLQGFNDWVHGLEVHQGELLVVSNNDIFRFDPATGRRAGSLPIAGLSGLACVSP